MQKLLVVLFLFSLSSCFILEEYENMLADPVIVEEEVSRQDIVQDTIIQYLGRQLDKGSYTPYTFGELFVTKPKEVKELEQLYELKETLPSMTDHYGTRLDSVVIANDTAIAQKRREIKAKKVYPIYDITHLFLAKEDDGHIIYEMKFFTYPNNKVKDLNTIFSLPISTKEKTLLEHFIHQDPLIFSNDYDYAAQMNSSIYNRLNNALIIEPAASKSELMATTLLMVDFYIKNNGFDGDLFANAVISRWIKKQEGLSNPKVSRITKLAEIIKEQASDDENAIPREVIIGYKKFMELSAKDGEGNPVIKALYCEFDKNYVLKGVLPLEEDYEGYFE